MSEEEKKELRAKVAALVGEQHLRVTDLDHLSNQQRKIGRNGLRD